MIREEIKFETNKSGATSPEMQVMATLLYMRSPIFQEQVGTILGLSQSTVSNCIRRVTSSLAGIANQFIVFPTTNEVNNLETE